MEWIDSVLQGLMLGGIYALYALGLSLMFGVMRLVNTAHGDLVILLAYGGLAITGALVPNPFVAAALLVPCAMVVGYALQRLVLNRTLGQDPLPSIIATFGISVVVQNALLELYSADARALPTLGLESAAMEVGGGLRVGLLSALTLALAVAITAGFAWVMDRTRIGRELRAAADDADAAAMIGIRPQHVYAVATAFAFAFLAVASVLVGMRVTFSPSDGPAQLIFAFEAVIIGGLGSIWGAFAGGLLLGVAQSVGFRVSPGWGLLVGHLVFLAMLGVRPQGLFPRTRAA